MHNIFHAPVNITAITLIPKVQNTSLVKDFSPISCCTVVYKIVAKILTSRLQQVVCGLVNIARSDFIPGR